MKEYIEEKYEEFNSGDVKTQENIVAQLKEESRKLEYFINRLERILNDDGKDDEDPWQDYTNTEMKAITK